MVCQFKKPPHLRRKRRRLVPQPLGQTLALAHKKTVVQHRQGLQRSDGRLPLGRVLRGVRAIHQLHQRIRHGAKDKPIHATPKVRRRIRVKPDVVEVRRHVHPLAHVEMTSGWAAHFQIRISGQLQQRITVRFRVEPHPVHPPQPTVVRVSACVLRIVRGVLLINRAGHDGAMQPLQRTAPCTKFERQPIQQLRM